MKFTKFFIAAAVAFAVPAAAYTFDRYTFDKYTYDNVRAAVSFPPSVSTDGRYWG